MTQRSGVPGASVRRKINMLQVREWEALSKQLCATLPRRRSNGKRVRVLQAQLYARGVQASELTQRATGALQPV